MMETATRRERDSLGELDVPAEAWYGIQTLRAVHNFPVSGRGPDRDFVNAHVQVKHAAATANEQARWLDRRRAEAIRQACQRILDGEFREQFVVDRFQAGAGTSHNMNTNEVVANLANVALGGNRGTYDPVHPNDHVNMSQSTNDTIPTAIRLACLAKIPRLIHALRDMAGRLETLAAQEATTEKSARTHLQDAVPTTLGRELGSYAWTLRRCANRLNATRPQLCELGLGGSAAGTGLNTPRGYAHHAAAALAELTGEPLQAADDLNAQMQSMHDLQQLSSTVRDIALELGRIANDVRLLASGPRTGLAELRLPPVQPGSSIMPGKVNPVMYEMLNQVCYQVIGQDAAVAGMSQAGQLELNVMMPALGSALFDGMDWLTAAVEAVNARGIEGIEVDRERCRLYLNASVGLATLLNTRVGYMRAAELAKESEQSGRPVRDLVIEREVMTAEEFDRMVSRAARDGVIDDGS